MPGLIYLNFILRVEKAEDRFRASVIESPMGPADNTFDLPFKEEELNNFSVTLGQLRQGVDDVRTSALAQAQDYGARLFQAVFSEQVYTNFVTSYNLALQLGKGLRLQLRISDPRLMNLPWEYLYNPDSKSYLSQDNKSPVVRYLDWGGQVVPLSVELPLRILVVIASPDGLPNLKVEEEWLRLNRALDPLIKRRLVQVDRLKKPTLDFLQSYLRRNTCHILHFIGHGVFNPTTKEGLLNFENDEGKNQEVKGQHLGSILRNHASLRLVVLNACEGAQTAINDPFAGIAQSLVQQGLPAVIAMQFPITDQAALKFSHEFYAALADGYALDAALTEARVAIFATGNNIEWGTPVLFMRSTDGKLFNFKPARWYWIAAIIGITVILLAAIGLLKLVPSLFSSSPTFTQISQISTLSPQPSFTSSPPSPTLSFTRTPTLTTLPTSSQTPTPSITPRPLLPNQVKQAITQEASLEMTRNPSAAALEAIFWPDAQVKDMSTGQEWIYTDFYQQAHATITENRHENVTTTEFSASHITLLTDNCRVYKNSGKEEPFGNILGDQWEFDLREGVWKITNLSIKSASPSSITYTFEDGTRGCWNISGEAGKSLGANLANSTDLSQEGSHSLALEYDLAATPDEPRARIEHYASAPLNGLRKLSAWIYISAETQLTPLQVQFFAWTTSEVWSVNEFQVVQPNTWTYLETSAFNPVLTYAQVKMLGIELKLPASSAVTSLKGTAFIDQFHIESNP